MANQEHLDILRQGVEAWNEWRKKNWNIKPELSEADLRGADLSRAVLSPVILDGADFTGATCGNGTFGGTDLSHVKGLESIKHLGRSEIGIQTLYLSQGKIPEIFLRGCGIPEDFITFLPSLIEKTIQFYSCFISYSHADKEFAHGLHNRLQGEGISCWLDEHQLNPGDPLHRTIYEAIRVYDKVLICCSETSLNSWWVEKEYSRAIKKEEDYNQPLIVPLNLDGYVFMPECIGWVADDIKQRLVADFVAWKDHDEFEKAVKTVINSLRPDGGKPPPPQRKLKPKR